MQNHRQYRLEKSPSGFALICAEAPIPVPGANEVLVRIRAVSLNRRDVLIRDGQYPVAMEDGGSFVPCSDGAGEITAIGAGAQRFAIGDRVAAAFMPAWIDGKMPPAAPYSALGMGGIGVLSEYIVIDEAGLVPIPPSFSFEEAATLPCAGVTAWNAVHELGRVAAGEQVLVQGTGSVSLFALQLAVALHARAIVISSSDAKLARCVDMGAAATLNYRDQPDWADAVRALTGGTGVDQVIDVGGAATLDASLAALAAGGHIALVGGLGGFPTSLSPMDLILRSARVSGVAVGSRAYLESLCAFLDRHDLRPVIDSVFDFDAAADAYDRIDAPNLFGNVVIRV